MADNVTKITIDGGSFVEGGHLDAKVLADLERYLTAFERAVNGATTQAERFSNMLKRQGAGGDFSKSFYVDSRATDKVLTALQAMQEKLNGATENRSFRFSSEEMDLYTATRTYKTRRSQNLAKEDLAYYGGKMTATGNPNKFTIAIPIEKGSLDTGDFASNVLKRADNAHIADLKYEQQKKEIAKQEREAEKKQLEDDKKREYAEKLHQKKGGILDYNKETGEYTLNGKPIEYPEEKDARKQKDSFFKTTGKALTKAGAVIGGIAGSMLLLTNIARRILSGVGKITERSRGAITSSVMNNSDFMLMSQYAQTADALGKNGSGILANAVGGIKEIFPYDKTLLKEEVFNGLANTFGDDSANMIKRAITQGNAGDPMSMLAMVYDQAFKMALEGRTLTEEGLKPSVAMNNILQSLNGAGFGSITPLIAMGWAQSQRQDQNNPFRNKNTLLSLLNTSPSISQDGTYLHNAANYNIAKGNLSATFQRALERIANNFLPFLVKLLERLNNFLVRTFGTKEDKEALNKEIKERNTKLQMQASALQELTASQASDFRKQAGIGQFQGKYLNGDQVTHGLKLVSRYTHNGVIDKSAVNSFGNEYDKALFKFIVDILENKGEVGRRYLFTMAQNAVAWHNNDKLKKELKKTKQNNVYLDDFNLEEAGVFANLFGWSTGATQARANLLTESLQYINDEDILRKLFKDANGNLMRGQLMGSYLSDGGKGADDTSITLTVLFKNADTGKTEERHLTLNTHQALDFEDTLWIQSMGGNNR